MPLLLTVKKMAKSTYYYHMSQSGKDKYAAEKARISDVFRQSGETYGYRRVTLQLKEDGYEINHKTVARLMREMGLKTKMKRRGYRSYKGEVGKVADNVIARNFMASRPLEKMATDITQINIGEKKLYMSALIDMHNGEVDGYTLSRHPDLELVISMMRNFIRENEIAQPMILHSDQGWHYQHPNFCKILKDNNITQSMSRKGNCYDNAMMESFFGTMKSELLYTHKFRNEYEFANALSEYVNYYNEKRIKLRLRTSPVNYRNKLINKQSNF